MVGAVVDGGTNGVSSWYIVVVVVVVAAAAVNETRITSGIGWYIAVVADAVADIASGISTKIVMTVPHSGGE